MGLLNKLFGKNDNSKGRQPEHGVIIHFQYGREDLAPFA